MALAPNGILKPADRVVFLTATLEIGGSETKIVKIANALAADGRDVAIAYLNAPETLLGKIDPGVDVINLKRTGKYSFKSLRRLIGLLRDGYGTVVTVNFYPLLYAIPATRKWAVGDTRVISLINTTEFVDRQRIFGPIYAPFIRRSDQIVFGCRAQQELWIGRYRLNPAKSIWLYNGVDSDRFAPYPDPVLRNEMRATWQIPEEAFVVGSVGRLAPEKNFDLLIDVIARLNDEGRNAYLVIVGEGAQRERLELKIAELGLVDKVRLPGPLSDIRPALSAMDTFVLPSRAVETFSNAALEAMSMQIPVVQSRIGGAAEMIEEGSSGLLFDAKDADMLAEHLQTLHDSREARTRLGSGARQRVLQEFRFRDMVANYDRLLFPEPNR